MTVKQVADMLHLSKNTIKYRMKKLPAEMIEREDGVIYILEAGIKELEKGKKAYEPPRPAEEPRSLDPNQHNNHDEVVELLKAQIEDLKKDKENLLVIIEGLNQQIADMNQQNKNLTQFATVLKLEADTKKQGFFSRFRKKKEE